MSFVHSNIARVPFTLTIASSGTTITSGGTPLNGVLMGFTAVVPALDAATTLAVSVADADGTVLYSKSGLAASAKTPSFTDANNAYLRIPVSGSHTVTVTASGTQTASRVITVNLLISK